MRAELWTMIVVVQLQWPVDRVKLTGIGRGAAARGSAELRTVMKVFEAGIGRGAAARGTWVPCGTSDRSSQKPFGRDLLGTS